MREISIKKNSFPKNMNIFPELRRTELLKKMLLIFKKFLNSERILKKLSE